MDEFTKYLLTAAAPATIGFIGWCVNSIVRLRSDVATLRLHVAENYPKVQDINDIKGQLQELGKVTYLIAGKLGISIKE